MSKLTEYQSKRDFKRTTEPAGREKRRKGKEPVFVVQKHEASRLHYDFRLEIDGVLKSWSVPKGPSYNPSDKRLAVETEDHPLSYADFEGNIPQGEYGGGSVIIWDTGSWDHESEEKSALEAYEQGEIKFTLHGHKLKGGYVLVKMKGRGDKQWLLIKHDDKYADRRKQPVLSAPKSVKSGKTNQEISREA